MNYSETVFKFVVNNLKLVFVKYISRRMIRE